MESPDYCVAGRLRLLSRVVTSYYNEAFMAEEVTFTQASLLMHLFALPGVRQVELSKRLQIEKSTLNRDIQLLQKRGWIIDNIRKGLYLTESGTIKAKQCHKIWKGLHQRVTEGLGAETVQALAAITDQILALRPTRKQSDR